MQLFDLHGSRSLGEKKKHRLRIVCSRVFRRELRAVIAWGVRDLEVLSIFLEFWTKFKGLVKALGIYCAERGNLSCVGLNLCGVELTCL